MKTDLKIISNFILVLAVGFLVIGFLRCRNSPTTVHEGIDLKGTAKLTQQEEVDPTNITEDVADRLHTNYVKSNCMVNTKRVVFDFTKFKSISDRIVKEKSIQSEALVFISYYGRYDTSDGNDADNNPLRDRNTIIINFASIDEQGKVVPMADEIWDFGDTRPPKAGEIDIVSVIP